ncbi:YgaP family membrane protein [Campylobacter concisus]
MVSVKSRIIRVVLGLAFMAAVWYFYESYWALIGLIPINVGVTGFCPACKFLGRCSLNLKR